VGTINNVLIILKYYIYVCRCKCRTLNLEGGLEFLKYVINIEKASMVYLSPVQKERVTVFSQAKNYGISTDFQESANC
jgi:hypothetical protein